MKALRLFLRTRDAITSRDEVPDWVGKVIEKIKALPLEAESVLLVEEKEKGPVDDSESTLFSEM